MHTISVYRRDNGEWRGRYSKLTRQPSQFLAERRTWTDIFPSITTHIPLSREDWRLTSPQDMETLSKGLDEKISLLISVCCKTEGYYLG